MPELLGNKVSFYGLLFSGKNQSPLESLVGSNYGTLDCSLQICRSWNTQQMPDEGTTGNYVPSLPDSAERGSRTSDVICGRLGNDVTTLSARKCCLTVVFEEALWFRMTYSS